MSVLLCDRVQSLLRRRVYLHLFNTAGARGGNVTWFGMKKEARRRTHIYPLQKTVRDGTYGKSIN